MISTYDFLRKEAISHLNSANGIIKHLQEIYQSTGDERARQALESFDISLKSFSFIGSPATGKNIDDETDSNHLVGSPESGLNYFAPTKNLQVLLCQDWFDEACADKKKYTTAWRNHLIEALMASEYRDEIAKAWENKNLRLQIKGHVMGALMNAGIFIKKKALPIARIYYGTRENTTEVGTLAKYMGDSRKTYYADWIIEYVKNKSFENQTLPIEK